MADDTVNCIIKCLCGAVITFSVSAWIVNIIFYILLDSNKTVEVFFWYFMSIAAYPVLAAIIMAAMVKNNYKKRWVEVATVVFVIALAYTVSYVAILAKYSIVGKDPITSFIQEYKQYFITAVVGSFEIVLLLIGWFTYWYGKTMRIITPSL